jgi:hypothetical protein
MRAFTVFVWVVMLGFACATCAQTKPTNKLTGIYSDMSYSDDSGDVLGDEIFLVFSNRGYYAVFQGSEGEPYVPVVVPVKVEGNSISFTLPASTDPRGKFQGKITNGELTGTFSGNAQTVHLKRKASYWQ